MSMHMAPRAAAWVAWAVWTCNSTRRGFRAAAAGYGQKRAGFGPLFFLGGVRVRVGADEHREIFMTAIRACFVLTTSLISFAAFANDAPPSDASLQELSTLAH